MYCSPSLGPRFSPERKNPAIYLPKAYSVRGTTLNDEKSHTEAVNNTQKRKALTPSPPPVFRFDLPFLDAYIVQSSSASQLEIFGFQASGKNNNTHLHDQGERVCHHRGLQLPPVIFQA